MPPVCSSSRSARICPPSGANDAFSPVSASRSAREIMHAFQGATGAVAATAGSSVGAGEAAGVGGDGGAGAGGAAGREGAVEGEDAAEDEGAAGPDGAAGAEDATGVDCAVGGRGAATAGEPALPQPPAIAIASSRGVVVQVMKDL